MPGMGMLPLNFLLILESIPCGFLQDAYANALTKGWFSYSDSHEFVRLEADGVLLNLLNDLGLVQGLDGHFNIY